jgi:iron complex transport system substrate-binding protein
MAHKLVAIDIHSANVGRLPEGLVKLDFFYPDAEIIVKLQPDIIIASGHNPTGSGEDPFRLLGEMGIPVVYISMSQRIEEIYNDIEFIADLGMAHKLVAIDVHSANVGGLPEGLAMLDFFYPDAEVIIKLQPDIIIASGHHPTGSGEDPFRLLGEMGIAVVYIPMSRSIEEIYRDIEFVADILDVKKNGEELVRSMRGQIAEITAKTALVENKRSVYFEISTAPEMFTFGKDSFIDDMIRAIGARNIFEDGPWLISPGAESIIERNPDVIITNVNWIDDPIGEVRSRQGFEHINAVINNRIYTVDGDSSSRPSSRIILALGQMARAVYPEIYE